MSIKTFEFDGLDDLIRAFAKLGDDALPKLREASIAASEKVLYKAKQKLEPHYKSGDLFHALKVIKPTNSSKTSYKIYARVSFSKTGTHGVPLELGHKLVINGNKVGTVKEVPFLRPAADESKEQVANDIAAAMNKALDEMGGRK